MGKLWEGCSVAYYQLSDPVFHFTIDARHGGLYGLSDRPEFHVTVYKLPEID